MPKKNDTDPGKMIQFKVGTACYENFRRIGEPLGLSANTAARYLAMKALEQSRASEALSGMGAIFDQIGASSCVPTNKRRKA